MQADASNQANKMIQQLASLRGIGVQSATVPVPEQWIAHAKRMAPLCGTKKAEKALFGSAAVQGDR
jgi:hypothetical protein